MVRDPVAAKVAVIATTGAVGFAASGITADVVSVAEARGAALFSVAAIAEEATTTAGFAEAGLAVKVRQWKCDQWRKQISGDRHCYLNRWERQGEE